jgi:hypothetical protein
MILTQSGSYGRMRQKKDGVGRKLFDFDAARNSLDKDFLVTI